MRLMMIQWLAVSSLLMSAVGCSWLEASPNAQQGEEPSVFVSRTNTPSIGQTQPLLIEPELASDLGYRLGWASPVKLLPGQEITSVTVLGDLVFVIENPQNTVTALRADNGKLAWKVSLGSDLENLFTPSRDGQQVFIHSQTRMFTLDAKEGAVTAVANLETTVGSAAVYSKDFRLMIMTGVNGTAFAHGVDTNFSRWRYKMANRISTSPVLAEQDVFIVDTGGTYAMLETQTGNILWRNRTLGPVNTKAGIQDSEIIVASSDGKLYALNRTTGRDTWIYLGAEQPLNASPSILGRLIIQPLLPNNGMVAIDAINGDEIWRSDINAQPILTRQQDMLLHTDRALISVDLNSGEKLVEVPTRQLLTVVPAGDDNSLVLVTPSGRLMRLSPK